MTGNLRLVPKHTEDPIGRERTGRALQSANRQLQLAVNAFSQAYTPAEIHHAKEAVLEALTAQKSAWDAFEAVVQGEWS